jgi:4-amino-4-deoxy-L-arabinose transferase-like glycosyltransferase
MLSRTFTLPAKLHKWLLWGFALLVIIRVALLFAIPLTDTTEARYAEIARKMVETNDWITPQYDYGVPFWGKPPLHTWLSALGIKLFGVNEFASRIFIFLPSVALLVALFRWTRRIRGHDFALAGTFIIASNILFFIASATVMTDLIMVVGTTLCMIGFWDNLHRENQSPWRRYIFFLGLAIGLLAKGPVATVISAIPIALWVLINNRWIDTWKKIPWISGFAFTLLLSLPWYIAAELKTPGFLEYFIVGEHFHRFIDTGWTGDRYGKGHAHIKGTIWLYSLIVLLPWTPFILAPLTKIKKITQAIRQDSEKWTLYLICWGTAPMLFFTLAGNILPSYVLPAIPAIGFLALELWSQSTSPASVTSPEWCKFYSSSMATSLVIVTSTLIGISIYPQLVAHKCEKFTVQYTQQQRKGNLGNLYYWEKRFYSAEFYSQGNATTIYDLKKLNASLSNDRKDFIVIRKKDLRDIPAKIMDHLHLEKESEKKLLFSDSLPPMP